MTEMMGDMSDLMRMLAEDEGDGGVLAMIMQILDALVWILGLTVIAILIIRLVRTIIRLLLSNRQFGNKGVRTYRVKNEVRVRIQQEETDRKRMSIFKTPAEKVRQIYKKELQKYKKTERISGEQKRPAKTAALWQRRKDMISALQRLSMRECGTALMRK